MLELRRAAPGFGRLTLDDAGVTRSGLFRTRSIGWRELREYRLSLELHGVSGDAGYLALGPLSTIWDALQGAQGRHEYRFGIELRGEHTRLRFDWRFRNVELAIREVLRRLHAPLIAAAHAELVEAGVARFGPLALGRAAVMLGSRAPLPQRHVEAIELFDAFPVRLRVMAHGRAWPHAQVRMDHVPNVLAALEVARSLGYPVLGRELLVPRLRDS